MSTKPRVHRTGAFDMQGGKVAYVQKAGSYEAVQWTGDNQAAVEAAAVEWTGDRVDPGTVNIDGNLVIRMKDPLIAYWDIEPGGWYVRGPMWNDASTSTAITAYTGDYFAARFQTA